jgi:predicted GIY-YIG superfamily endonuclease
VTYVYILRCADRSLYVGHTLDPEARKRAHDQGTASNHTAKRRPLEMVYLEACGSLAEAVNRERQLKRWSSAKKEALIAGDTGALQALSRRRRRPLPARA